MKEASQVKYIFHHPFDSLHAVVKKYMVISSHNSSLFWRHGAGEHNLGLNYMHIL